MVLDFERSFEVTKTRSDSGIVDIVKHSFEQGPAVQLISTFHRNDHLNTFLSISGFRDFFLVTRIIGLHRDLGCCFAKEARKLRCWCFFVFWTKDGKMETENPHFSETILKFLTLPKGFVRSHPERQFNISFPDTLLVGLVLEKILSWNLPWLRSRNPVKTVRSVPSRKAATRKQCFWYVTFEAAINRMKTWKHGCKNGHFVGLIWLLNEFVCLNVCMFCDNLLIQSWEIDRQRLLGPKPAPLPDRRALRGASASGTDGGGFGGRCHWADGESKIDWTEEDISNIKGWSRTFRMPQVQL